MKAIYTLLILLIPFVGFGQNVLDEIHYTDWSIKKVKIIEENPKNIKYSYKNEDLIITEDIDKISKIIFSSGRVKKFKDKIGPNPKLLKQKIKNDSILKLQKIKNDSILKLNKKVKLKKYKEEFIKNSRSSFTIHSGLSFSNRKYFEGIFKPLDTRFKIGHYHSVKYNFKINRHNFSLKTSFIQKGFQESADQQITNPYDTADNNPKGYNRYANTEFNYLKFSSNYNVNKIISQKMIINFDIGPSIDFYISDRGYYTFSVPISDIQPADNYYQDIIVENVYSDVPGFNKFTLGINSSSTLNYMLNNIQIGIGLGADYSFSKVVNRKEVVNNYAISVFNFITFTNYVSISFLFD